MEITLKGVQPYDGTYELDFAGELTTRECGWIKRYSGYLPVNLEDAIDGGDAEFMCVMGRDRAAPRRAGSSRATRRRVFDKLIDAPFGSAITIEVERRRGGRRGR